MQQRALPTLGRALSRPVNAPFGKKSPKFAEIDPKGALMQPGEGQPAQ
jgi:hypothetical protein